MTEQYKKEIQKFDDEYILNLMNFMFPDHPDTFQTIRFKTYMRNILYFLGEQWISWYTDNERFGNIYSIPNLTEPTPVTNFIRDYVKSVRALILNKEYKLVGFPNSREIRDTDASKLLVQILESDDDAKGQRIEDVKSLAALWYILCGLGLVETMPKRDSGMYVIGKSGSAVTPQGDISNNIIIPFNFACDLLGTFLEDKRYIGVQDIKPREWVQDIHKVLIPKQDNASMYSLSSSDFQKQLFTLIATVSSWKGGPVEAPSNFNILEGDDMVVYKRLEMKPTKDFPKGRCAYVAGGKVLEKKKELPIKTGKQGQWFYTVTDFSYNPTPGSFWPTGGVDDQISPQNTINQIDQAQIINRRSVGRPFIMTGLGTRFNRKSVAGSSFLHVELDTRSSMGVNPRIESGTPYPATIQEERKNMVEGMQMAAGDPKNILRGQSPHAKASGVLVGILREAAEMSHTPDIKSFYRSWNRVYKKRAVLIPQVITEKRMLKIIGDGNEIIVKEFKGADLYDNTDVRIMMDTGIATTPTGKNQMIVEMAKTGIFFRDLPEKPAAQAELLERMGIAKLPDEENLHIDRAKWENSIIAEGNTEMIKQIQFPGIPAMMEDNEGNIIPAINPETGEILEYDEPPTEDPLFEYDPDPIHLKIHDTALFSREFKSWEPEKQILLIEHRRIHYERLQMAMEKQREQQLQEALLAKHPQLLEEEGISEAFGAAEGQRGAPQEEGM